MKSIHHSAEQKAVGLFGRVVPVIGRGSEAVVFMLSVAAAVIGGGWLFTQRQTIAAIEKETSSLEQQIATARFPSPDRSVVAEQKTTADAESEDGDFDWKLVLSQLSDQGDRRELTRLYNRLKGMTVREIAAALDEIGRLEMDPHSIYQLERIFLPSLLEKDPVAALARFLKSANSGLAGPAECGALAKAFGTWAQKDSGNANAWMDRAISSGTFENKSLVGASPMRIQLEEQLVRVLSRSDPAAAKLRLAGLTEDAAFSVLLRTFADDDRKDEDAAIAKLTRDTLSASRSVEIFSNEASRLSKNYADVTAYLDRINASPAERETCVETVAGTRMRGITYDRSITLEDVDAMREWAGTNHADIDRVTGKSLGNAINANRMSFDEASAIVLHYYEASGDDTIIRSFLASDARGFGDQARALAGKIADPDQRAEILDRIW